MYYAILANRFGRFQITYFLGLPTISNRDDVVIAASSHADGSGFYRWGGTPPILQPKY